MVIWEKGLKLMVEISFPNGYKEVIQKDNIKAASIIKMVDQVISANKRNSAIRGMFFDGGWEINISEKGA